MATTYITGTWTALILTWATPRRHRRDSEPDGGRRIRTRALVIAGYLAGAFAGGFAFLAWRGAATAVPLAVLLGVLLGVVAAARVRAGEA